MKYKYDLPTTKEVLRLKQWRRSWQWNFSKRTLKHDNSSFYMTHSWGPMFGWYRFFELFGKCIRICPIFTLLGWDIVCWYTGILRSKAQWRRWWWNWWERKRRWMTFDFNSVRRPKTWASQDRWCTFEENWDFDHWVEAEVWCFAQHQVIAWGIESKK